jgi:hypothetical protein
MQQILGQREQRRNATKCNGSLCDPVQPALWAPGCICPSALTSQFSRSFQALLPPKSSKLISIDAHDMLHWCCYCRQRQLLLQHMACAVYSSCRLTLALPQGT